ncbi:hypothetical protein [Chishuiella changwenlii]|jgi:hypothetical protein|uniref:hypothetical protein n=1 Tax=Chishuiella changwenlii TaxID=1434701 RepID=UPI002FD91B34
MKQNFIISLILLSFIGCSEEELDLSKNSNQKNSFESELILKERETGFPIILSNKMESKNTLFPGEPTEIQYFLGRSFKDNSTPISSPENISFPVLDIERLYNDNKNYFDIKSLNISEAKSFSFSSFEKYEEKSSFVKKVDKGFSLDLGLFKLGSKKKYEETFSSHIVNNSNSVFGELNLIYKNNSYSLQNSSNLNKRYYPYIMKELVNELFNTTTSEFIKTYGRFVLTGFISGGSATALYAGVLSNSSNEVIKESKLDKNISVSYGFKTKTGSDGKISGDLAFNRSNGSGTINSDGFSAINVAVKTIGGNNGLSGFTAPKGIEDINLNLSSWVESLNDRKTMTLVDISDNGLSFISDFVLEKDFKSLLENYDEQKQQSQKLIEPYILIEYYEDDDFEEYFMKLSMVNRFGYPIELYTVFEGYNNEKSLQKTFSDIASSFSGVKQVYKKYDMYGYGRSYRNRDMFDITKYENKINNRVLINMFKFNNPQNNLTYIMGLDSFGKKIAFTVHNDYIYDTYVIRNWVNSLPTKSISNEEFITYNFLRL